MTRLHNVKVYFNNDQVVKVRHEKISIGADDVHYTSAFETEAIMENEKLIILFSDTFTIKLPAEVKGSIVMNYNIEFDDNFAIKSLKPISDTVSIPMEVK